MTFAPTPAQIDAAFAHAKACAPLECCGLIAGGEFIPVKNLSPDPNHFVLDRHAFVRVAAKATVQAIVHSHVNAPAMAGVADRAACAASGLPWVIVSVPGGGWCQIEPTRSGPPLCGREWRFGVHDCFSLIRDAFFDYTGIRLPDFERMAYLNNFRTEDHISSHIEETGFVRMEIGTPPRHCDLLGLRINGEVPNHLALFVTPDQILHQLYQRLSTRELYDGAYQRRTVLHLRHRSLM